MVALGRELCLRGLRVVEVERIVDRHRHELRDLARKVTSAGVQATGRRLRRQAHRPAGARS